MKLTEARKILLRNKDFASLYNSRKSNRTIGKNVLIRRLELNITQKRLADLTDTKQPAIARIENGDLNITYLTLEKIAHALETNVANLIPKKERIIKQYNFAVDQNQEYEDILTISDWKLSKLIKDNKSCLVNQNSENIIGNLTFDGGYND